MMDPPKFDETPRPGIRLPDLAGRVALVTGTSAGIGRATAEALLANGAIVYGVDHEKAVIEQTGFHALCCDLRDAKVITKTVAEIGRQATHLDYVVNVAGVDTKASIDEGGAEHWQSIVDLNLRAYYLILHESVPWLRLGQGKSIVNLSSINYRLGVPKRSIYSTTKAGILGLTTGLARELGSEGIRVNAISPGWVFTDWQVKQYFTGEVEVKNLNYLAQVQSLGLKINGEDIANHILFYLSDVSRASTGHNCVVDAGWTLE
jgi:D-xylose 1-dehydrogenase|uniref:SDR family NAD(P)-dependent oxidoreductase n=1 Tax=Cephaloticoccus sp. TaxID=1985742 RepID=UPI004049BB37